MGPGPFTCTHPCYPQSMINVLQAPGQDVSCVQQQTLPAPRVSFPTNHSVPKLLLEKFVFGHGFLSWWSAVSSTRGEWSVTHAV